MAAGRRGAAAPARARGQTACQAPPPGRRGSGARCWRRGWVVAAAALAAAAAAAAHLRAWRYFVLPAGSPLRSCRRGAAVRHGHRTPSAATALEPAAAEYVVTIDKTGGGKLGLRLEHQVNASELFVTNVTEGLLCERWNAANPDQAVAPGDLLLEVNGVQGSATLMKEECRKDVVLSMRLRRGAGPLASAGRRVALIGKHVMVAPSSIHGFGVFAAKDFAKGEVLHESPGRLVRGNTSEGEELHELQDDVFELGWDDPNAHELSILGLGFASLHNHADPPNAEVMWERSERHGGMVVGTFYALKAVSQGEELFIHYGDKWWSTRANQTAAAAPAAPR